MTEVSSGPPPQTPPSNATSPVKPRLLWRGNLHLADGTALRGLAIVSSIQPGFARITPTRDGSTSLAPSTTETGPFTMSQEQQDQLSLSIEMVRHAPLRAVDVIEEGVGIDAQGRIALLDRLSHEARPTMMDPSIGILPNRTIQTTFETAGNVRLYIDPTQRSTVAYFDRLMAYGLERISDKDTSSTIPSCASAALVFSLDRSYKPPRSASGSGTGHWWEEIKQDPAWSGMAADGEGDRAMDPFGGHGTVMAAVVGIRRQVGQESLVELHIAKQVVRRMHPGARMAPPSTTIGSVSTLANATDANTVPSLMRTGSQPTRSLRPDDPAPRGIPRILFRSSTGPGLAQGQPSPLDPPRVQLASQEPLEPSKPATTATASSSLPSPPRKVHARGGNHTPGRRGEKRRKTMANLEASVSAVPSLSTSNDQSNSGDSAVVKSEPMDQMDLPPLDPPVQPHTKPADPPSTLAASSKSTSTQARTKKEVGADVASSSSSALTNSIEERNRSLIKKLVHHQLLGMGVERHGTEYAACFMPTYQGTLVALRKSIKETPIDRQTAAELVKRHVDMYL